MQASLSLGKIAFRHAKNAKNTDDAIFQLAFPVSTTSVQKYCMKLVCAEIL